MDSEELIATYERAINETDSDRQQEAARRALAEDLQFVGPQAGEVTGREAFVDTIRALREQAPSDDVRIRRTTEIDEHHGWLRFGWEFVDQSGEAFAHGTDVAKVGSDGKLAKIVVFFGDLSPEAA